MELMGYEWVVVENQCINCKWWHKDAGCEEPTAASPRPVEDCGAKEDR